MVRKMLGLSLPSPTRTAPLPARYDRDEDDRKFEAVREKYELLMDKIRRLEAEHKDQ